MPTEIIFRNPPLRLHTFVQRGDLGLFAGLADPEEVVGPDQDAVGGAGLQVPQDDPRALPGHGQLAALGRAAGTVGCCVARCCKKSTAQL